MCPKPRHLRHLVTTTKYLTLHMFQWRLIFWRTTNSPRRFELTSMTTCLESSKVLLVNFMLSAGSSVCDRLFCWSIVSLIATSSISVGTNISSNVGSFLLGRSTVTVLNLLNSFSSMSLSVLFLHCTSNALFARFLGLLTPSLSASGSTASFTSRFVSWNEVFGSAALTISPTVWGGLRCGVKFFLQVCLGARRCR